MKAKLLIPFLIAVFFGASLAPAFAQTTTSSAYYLPPNSASCPQLSYNLYRGLSDYYTGGQVTALQQFLNGRYGNQLVTGYFGPMTAANVARFQVEQSVYPITGGVGPLTRAAIARVCNGSGGGTSGGALSAQPQSGQAPLTVSFTGSVPSASQYIIDFGDGQTSGAILSGCLSNQPYPGYSGSASACSVSAAHTYASAGTYTATLSPYIGCMYSNPRCMIAVQNMGTATVTVTQGQQQSGLTVTSPLSGQTYARGSAMPISWSGLVYQTFAYEQDASIVDLYESNGVKVGTIAIGSGIFGSYSWSVPPFPNNRMCAMQYPNGLCGQNIQPGQYYIRVTVVRGSGFDANPSVIAAAQSGVFSIQ